MREEEVLFDLKVGPHLARSTWAAFVLCSKIRGSNPRKNLLTGHTPPVLQRPSSHPLNWLFLPALLPQDRGKHGYTWGAVASNRSPHFSTHCPFPLLSEKENRYGGYYLLKTLLKARKECSSLGCILALDGTHNKEAVSRGFSQFLKVGWDGKEQGFQNLSMKSHHHNGKGIWRTASGLAVHVSKTPAIWLERCLCCEVKSDFCTWTAYYKQADSKIHCTCVVSQHRYNPTALFLYKEWLTCGYICLQNVAFSLLLPWGSAHFGNGIQGYRVLRLCLCYKNLQKSPDQTLSKSLVSLCCLVLGPTSEFPWEELAGVLQTKPRE